MAENYRPAHLGLDNFTSTRHMVTGQQRIADNEIMDGPRVFSVASVVINLPMRLSHLPIRGSTVVVSGIGTEVGGAFNVMSAIIRQGVKVINLSPLGTGPNSMFARRVLTNENIDNASTEVVGDIGTKLVFIESDGHNTSILSPGVENDIPIRALSRLDIRDGDYVYVYGGDLTFPSYRRALVQWLQSLDCDVTVVMATSPLIDPLLVNEMACVLPFINVLTMNNREHNVLRKKFDLPEDSWENLYQAGLPRDAIILHRIGSQGCRIFTGESTTPVLVPPLPSHIIDTSGVGDAHTGVVIASLAQGMDIEQAVWRGNLAGSQVVAKVGSATCPTKEDLDQLELNASTQP